MRSLSLLFLFTALFAVAYADVDDSDFVAFDTIFINANSTGGNFTVSEDFDKDTFTWVSITANNTDNDPLLAGVILTLTYVEDGDNVTTTYISEDLTDSAADLSLEWAFAACDVNGTDKATWTLTLSYPSLVMDNGSDPSANNTGDNNTILFARGADDDLAINLYWSYVEGTLNPDDDSDVALVAHGITIPFKLSNTTNMTVTFENDDEDLTLEQLFSSVWLIDDCPTDPLNYTPTNTSIEWVLIGNNTVQFNETDVPAGDYNFYFVTAATVDEFDNDKKVNVNVVTSVEQDVDSSSSSTTSPLLPTWAWYAIIGGLAALLILILVGAIATVFVMRRRARYEAI